MGISRRKCENRKNQNNEIILYEIVECERTLDLLQNWATVEYEITQDLVDNAQQPDPQIKRMISELFYSYVDSTTFKKGKDEFFSNQNVVSAVLTQMNAFATVFNEEKTVRQILPIFLVLFSLQERSDLTSTTSLKHIFMLNELYFQNTMILSQNANFVNENLFLHFFNLSHPQLTKELVKQEENIHFVNTWLTHMSQHFFIGYFTLDIIEYLFEDFLHNHYFTFYKVLFVLLKEIMEKKKSVVLQKEVTKDFFFRNELPISKEFFQTHFKDFPYTSEHLFYLRTHLLAQSMENF
ncbi:hypothetical protein SNEBB_007484 [Seison nebaliae]|nr:hypothetical protein SNEBB_007484 [Seison nebaliae]